MDRSIRLDGCLNFRDLGGYPTRDGRTLRWRRLFRSDALHQLSEGDVGRLRDELGLCAVVDLRSSAELDRDGRGLLADESIVFHHLPLFDGGHDPIADAEAPIDLGHRYFLLAEFARAQLGRVVSTLAADDRPAVFHCAAGKDRTGLVGALVLSALGVEDDVVAADYALTRENIDAIIERLSERQSYREMLETLPPNTLHAEPETMLSLLRRLREAYGDVRSYLESAGVSEEAIARLEASTLERSRPPDRLARNPGRAR